MLLLILFLLLTSDDSTVTVAKHKMKVARETGVWSRGSIQAISPLESPPLFSKWQTCLINNRWQEGKEGAVWVMAWSQCCGAKLIMQPYSMSAEMSSPAMVMMKYRNMLRYLWRMPPPPPSSRPTMPEQDNKQLTSRAWYNVLPKKKIGEINKAFVMLYLYEKNCRGPLQGGQLVLSWITWVSVKCQLSGLLWKSRSRSLPRDNIQYQMSPDIDQDPGVTARFFFFPPPISPPPSVFTYPSQVLH